MSRAVAGKTYSAAAVLASTRQRAKIEHEKSPGTVMSDMGSLQLGSRHRDGSVDSSAYVAWQVRSPTARGVGTSWFLELLCSRLLHTSGLRMERASLSLLVVQAEQESC